ncbi:MAG: SMC family ATPase [Planctomycetaceae bacterium]|nr:SMC family ATPase [Planctomycetaceae bacterium]
MKPLKLTMSAFGSYADVQTVEFDKLGTSGVYLLTGNTGAGKTTIFDAISFALFGEASGEARNKSAMLRSDFAAEKAKTYVELDFVCGDNKYYIKRTIKASGKDVTLVLPDGTSMSGDGNIKSKIAEIVGLNRTQFAQIVMIAQNNFLRFLQSKTDNRLEILRHIFGTEAYRQFQERLRVRAKAEKDKLVLLEHDFERHQVNVHNRSEQFDAWEMQIGADKVELLEADKLIEQYDKQKQTLAAELAVAQDIFGKFADLGKFRLDSKEHHAKAGEIEQIKKRAARGEVSLNTVKPLADDAQKATTEHTAAQSALTEAKEQEIAAAAELDEAAKAIEMLYPLEEARYVLDALSKESDDAKKKLQILTDLQTGHNEIVGKQNTLTKMQEEFDVFNADFNAADEKHRAIEEAFLRGQAGILARSLADGKPCPVCGSTKHPAPAQLSDDNVTEEKLKKAKETKDKAQAKRYNKSSECDALKAEIVTLIKRFVSDFSKYASDVSWETSGTELANLLTQTQKTVKELTARCDADKKSFDKLTADWDFAKKRKTNAESAVKSAQTLVTERAANVLKLLQRRKETQDAYNAVLQENGFADEADYKAALVTKHELEALNKQVLDYEKRGEQLTLAVTRLESETAGKEQPDIEKLQTEKTTVDSETKVLGEKRDCINSRLSKMESDLKELRLAAVEFEKAEKNYAAVKQLASAANGKLDFETYVQIAYFEQVILAANVRLKLMSQNRYMLLRETDSDDGRERLGLGLEVFDAHTGKARSAKSLSGGESFMASLSLALGLSDIVQQSSGGIRLDAMFIDEGFGSLDAEVLELAIRTLSEMVGAGRIIGIISHVAELRERIDKQVRVEKTITGSRISLDG